MIDLQTHSLQAIILTDTESLTLGHPSDGQLLWRLDVEPLGIMRQILTDPLLTLDLTGGVLNHQQLMDDGGVI
jgi:hypothetical protein